MEAPYSLKLVFSFVVKGIKTKITAKFRAARHLRFKDTRTIVSPEMRPKTFRARKTIRKNGSPLFFKAGLFICSKGNKN